MPTNQATWLTAKSVRPLAVGKAPYTAPGENQLVVKNHAIAINPIDTIKQQAGNIVFSWIKYPAIMGLDVAGEVFEVGPGVTSFKVGDRVVALAVGMDVRSNSSSEGAFQEYTVIRTNMASHIPASVSYESASVLPLTLSTAACGMYQKEYLALDYPSLDPKPNGKTLLVWGGSTSVGCNAIQLAVASGYEVITTCSPRNFGLVKSLGASEAYDYNSKTVIKDIIAAFQGKECAGALAMGNGSLKACIAILGDCSMKGRKFISSASVDQPDGGFPSGLLGMLAMLPGMAAGMASTAIKSKVKGVGSKFISGSDLMVNEVGALIFEKFLPEALARGKYVCTPEPMVVGKGLEFVQEAMDIVGKGVSAKKVVVTL